MEIELDISKIQNECRTRIGEGVVARTIQAELQKIYDKHRKAAVEEMQGFIAQVITSEKVMNFGMTAVVKITIPDSK